MASEPSTEVSRPIDHDNEAMFTNLEVYPWSTDQEFQSGLQSILSQTLSPEQSEHLTLRARCFYYGRKFGVSLDFAAYKLWRAQRHTSNTFPNGTSSPSTPNATTTSSSVLERNATPGHKSASDPTEPPAPYPTTFSQIVELISTDQPIPGIKEVPDTVLEGQASQSIMGSRRKPWEKDHGGGGGGEEGLRIALQEAS